MPDCPTCSKYLPSERGMKSHHKRVHGESIAKEEFVCETCGEVDEYYPSWENGKFCSEKCMGLSMMGDDNPSRDPEVAEKISEALSGRERPWLRGEKNPAKRPEVRRKNSEAKIGTTLSEEHKEKISSSLKEHWSENPHPFEEFVMENHPQWKGGRRDYYGHSWTDELKESVRDRDDRECQECGISESSLDRSLDVHHIVPFRDFGIENHEKANQMENLVSLCHPCHAKIEPRAVAEELPSS